MCVGGGLGGGGRCMIFDPLLHGVLALFACIACAHMGDFYSFNAPRVLLGGGARVFCIGWRGGWGGGLSALGLMALTLRVLAPCVCTC